MKLACLCIAMVSLFAAACAKTPTIKSGAAPLPNLSAYHTYKYLEKVPQAHIDKVQNDELDRIIRKTIAYQLERRGLQQVVDNPDLLVTYRTNLSRTFSDTPRTKGKAEVHESAPWTARGLEPEGSLSIDLIEPVTQKLLWRGTARAVVRDIQDARVKVPEAVRALFSH